MSSVIEASIDGLSEFSKALERVGGSAMTF